MEQATQLARTGSVDSIKLVSVLEQSARAAKRACRRAHAIQYACHIAQRLLAMQNPAFAGLEGNALTRAISVTLKEVAAAAYWAKRKGGCPQPKAGRRRLRNTPSAWGSRPG
jgi:hypothetical protein